MSSKGSRRRRQKPSGRPSLFFIITLAVGVLLLIWIFANLITRPMTPTTKRGDLEYISHTT